MMETGAILTICFSGGGIILGIIGFFLKRTISQVDRLETDKASKKSVCDLEEEVNCVKETIGDIKTNYLTKEDFFREQAKTDRKLDRIMEILLDIKGGKQ